MDWFKHLSKRGALRRDVQLSENASGRASLSPTSACERAKWVKLISLLTFWKQQKINLLVAIKYVDLIGIAQSK